MVNTKAVVAIMVAVMPLVSSKEIPVNMQLQADLYDNGLRHGEIMALKEKTWRELDQVGVFDSTRYKTFNQAEGHVVCTNGVASYVPGDPKYAFRCKGLDLYDFKTHAQLGSSPGRGSGSWGWTSPQGREFVAIGQVDGTAFAEVSAAGKLIYLGRLPQYTNAPQSLWREIKGYKSFILIGSEATQHGIQIFDMSKLVDINPTKPIVFSNERDLTGFWTEGLPLGRSHNVLTNEERNYGVATGFQPRTGPFRAGLVFFDLTDPSNPKTLGGTGADGYVHDAQCLVYRGPDEKYNGRDICYGYDEDSLTIFDVSDKENISVISNTSYEGFAYTHQGWVLDPEWQQYLITDDEYDEVNKTGVAADGYPISYIWDITSLEQPKQTGHYKGLRRGIDHNQYVKDGFTYQSNYGLGLSILDLRSVPSDPTGGGIREVAYFDTHPEDDHLPGGGNVTFTGSWSNYPYFPSGHIVINTLDRGVFVVKRSSASE
ncbi:Regulatory P domain-containing protein [Madurella fahalii]|uniref:Regulatory P domain-containing protein n=1 Tax=Madurella fahalii TaxID=1157608 RepID=A0ABQ0GQ09_9PEZI